MYLSHLEVMQVRNLHSLQINPHPGINFIVGDNGSGKTSLLEAISLLSRGRSFRSPHIKKIISHERRDLTVFGQVMARPGEPAHRMGIRRTVTGETLAKIDGERCDRLSDLALLLPTVEVESTSFELLDGGSAARRELLDWGLFHVEHRFLDIWKRYKSALEQRNALLKSGDSANLRRTLPYWNSQLAEYGHALNELRLAYFERFERAIRELAQQYFGLDCISLAYQPGWNLERYPDLALCLEQHFAAELDKGRTLYGPHRADIEIRWQGQAARDICSRGQKKLVIYAVRLAQVVLFQREKKTAPILLLDDLPAELDRHNLERISRFLSDYPCQSFITAIEKDIQNNVFQNNVLTSTLGSHRMFHVEHGQLNNTPIHPMTAERDTPHV